jgi:hypothetical protein
VSLFEWFFPVGLKDDVKVMLAAARHIYLFVPFLFQLGRENK